MEYIILWIFALFGLWSIISNIIDGFYAQNNIGKFDIYLNVCNQEDAIESLIRDLSRVSMINKIKIIDNNSTDNTMEIIRRLKANNPKILIENDT